MFARTAADTATPNNAGSEDPSGSRRSTAEPNPLSSTARTTTASASTKAKNNGLAAPTRRGTVVRRCASARPPITTTPATAAHAGLTPANDVAANPASVNANTARANTGTGRRRTGTGTAGPSRSAAKNRRSTRYSTAITTSQGSDMRAPNRTKVKPLAVKASRLVRLDTCSSNDAELARCVHA